MSWCEYSTFYNIYLSAEVIFQRFILTSGQKFSSSREFFLFFYFNMYWSTRLTPSASGALFYYSPPLRVTSPSIIAAIKTKARHFPHSNVNNMSGSGSLPVCPVTNKIGKHFLFCDVTQCRDLIWFEYTCQSVPSKNLVQKAKNPVVWRLRIVWILKSFLRCILQTRVPLAWLDPRSAFALMEIYFF